MANKFELTTEQREAIRNGLLKHFISNELKVWLVIQSFMQEGVAFPSQRTIAETCGVTQRTVTTTMKKLLEITIDGQQVLTRELTGMQRKISFYKLPTDNWTSRTFITQFCEVYKETFGVNYNPNWGRDGAMLNKNLIGKFTDEQLQGMVEVGVREYARRWSNAQYKRPTIGMMCSWLSNQALSVWEEKKKQDERFKQTEEVDFTKFTEHGVI